MQEDLLSSSSDDSSTQTSRILSGPTLAQSRNSKLFVCGLVFSLVVLGSLVVFLAIFEHHHEHNPPSKDRIPLPGIANDPLTMLANQQVGLITNPTGFIADPRFPAVDSTIDFLFKVPGMQLVALFAPEHGIRGDHADGLPFEDSIDELTGLPVFSLFNPNRTYAPTAHQLSNVTALVFDIQDVGARFYTFISTLAVCMKSAWQNNKTFVVFDRANPLGRALRGNVLDPHWESFVGIWPIPLQHGLTVGELALLFKKEMGFNSLDLHVVPLKDYQPSQYPKPVLSPFIPPSPNLPSPDSIVYYPGFCLFEGMGNVSLGRGTATPFQLIGAPFMDALELLTLVNRSDEVRQFSAGFSFSTAYFIPTDSVHTGQLCQGIRILLSHWETADPLPLALALFKLIRQHYSQFTYFLSHFDYLMGSNSTRIAINDNQSVSSILTSWEPQHQQWQARIRDVLLY